MNFGRRWDGFRPTNAWWGSITWSHGECLNCRFLKERFRQLSAPNRSIVLHSEHGAGLSSASRNRLPLLIEVIHVGHPYLEAAQRVSISWQWLQGRFLIIFSTGLHTMTDIRLESINRYGPHCTPVHNRAPSSKVHRSRQSRPYLSFGWTCGYRRRSPQLLL